MSTSKSVCGQWILKECIYDKCFMKKFLNPKKVNFKMTNLTTYLELNSEKTSDLTSMHSSGNKSGAITSLEVFLTGEFIKHIMIDSNKKYCVLTLNIKNPLRKAAVPELNKTAADKMKGRFQCKL